MGSHVVYNLYKIHQKIDTETDRQIDRYTDADTESQKHGARETCKGLEPKHF